jgi:HK97 family phage major capsid protein
MLVVPIDETTPHGTSGVTAGWYAEGATIAATKPIIQQRNVPLWKAGCLVHLSDELIEDSPQMSQHVQKLMGTKLAATVEAALINGDGVGKPIGLLSTANPGAVTVDNTTTTLSAVDLLNLISRLPAGTLDGAFWLMHSSCLPYVAGLTLGQVPVVQPDFTVSPYGKILGRPIFVSEYCQSWNAAAGDLNLISPEGVITVVKAGGAQMASTIGFAFDAALQSFRCTVRIGQVPVLSAPIARANGTLTLSHVLKLDVRN